MKKVFLGFALAVSMLSTLPFFKVHDFFKGINGYAVMFYPLVGAILGGALLLCYTLLAPWFAHEHLMVLLFALWVLLTGALHLDGFADSVDGLFVARERALEVMKDAHVGGMGMLFSGVFLILKASALWHLEMLWALPLLLMLARYNAALAIYLFAYAPASGMGTLAKAEFSRSQLLSATAMVAVGVAVTPQGWALLAVSLLSLLAVRYTVARRLGGFSGDVYGFTIELSELAMLHLLILGVSA